MHPRGQVVCAALVAFFILAVPAAGHSGDVTRAEADSEWTVGSLAGSVTLDSCAGPPCTWLTIGTMQPSLPTYNCRGDEWADNDPNTLVVWNGSSSNGTGMRTLTFDLNGVRILPGVHGQRLCLLVVETSFQQEPVCLAQAPILGMDLASCPAVKTINGTVVGQRILTESQPAPVAAATPTPIQSPAPGSAPASIPAPAPLTKAAAAREARDSLGRYGGRSWRKRRKATVHCVRETDEILVCKARWRYKDRPRSRRVLVSRGPDGEVTTTFLRRA